MARPGACRPEPVVRRAAWNGSICLRYDPLPMSPGRTLVELHALAVAMALWWTQMALNFLWSPTFIWRIGRKSRLPSF